MQVLATAVLVLAPLATGSRAADLAKLEKTFSIEIQVSSETFTFETQHGAVTGTAAESEEIAAYTRLLTFEFGLYPESFVRRTKLKRIVLCKELAFDGQVRAAVPEFGSDTLFLDVAKGSQSEVYQRRVIHHDFFHIVDWQDDFQLYEDDAWTALNAEGFEYGDGGANAQDDDRMSLLTDEHPGFLTLYGRTGVEEDKAELFSFLFVDPVTVEQRAAGDEVLARKVEAMRGLLSKVSKDFDATYWKKIGAIERPVPKDALPGEPGAGQR